MLLSGLKRVDATHSFTPSEGPHQQYTSGTPTREIGWDQILDSITKPEGPEQQVPRWRKAVNYFCCLQDAASGQASTGDEYLVTSPSGRPYTDEEKARIAAESIQEDKFWRRYIPHYQGAATKLSGTQNDNGVERI
jgi:hypothetical protein